MRSNYVKQLIKDLSKFGYKHFYIKNADEWIYIVKDSKIVAEIGPDDTLYWIKEQKEISKTTKKLVPVVLEANILYIKENDKYVFFQSIS